MPAVRAHAAWSGLALLLLLMATAAWAAPSFPELSGRVVDEAGMIDASDRQVRASQLALDGVREEFRLGARTTLDVLDQEQELLDAQTSLVSAGVDRQIAVYQVLDSMGLLTAERLGLNVPIYDPSAYYNAVKDAPVRKVSPQGEKLDHVLESLMKQNQ